jgi:diguanylate cyclase (GGDEF)-like protein/PAS domain S-box-containing protein
MDDLMQGILGENANQIDIEIHDGNDLSAKTVMYDPDLSGNIAWEKSNFHTSKLIEIAGHQWTLAVRSQDGFEARLDRKRPLLIAFSGVVASMLLALLTQVLAQSRVRALRSAHQINRELTERKRAQEGLRLAAIVLSMVEEAVIVTDADNNIISVNPAFSTITGYSANEVLGKNPRIFSSGKHSPEFYHEMWETMLATGTWRGEIWDRRKNGEFYIKWLSIKLVRNEAGELTHYMAVFTDISERKQAEERMQHLAHHDSLTGLPNRTLFNDRLQQSIAKAKRDKTRLALMFLDLDKFKPVNDTYGHAVGDLLLKEVAKRLHECIKRESDTAARLGGDEFVLLLPSIATAEYARLVADKVLRSLAQPFELACHTLNISVTIGIAIYPEDGKNELILTKNADIAMYYAKAAGRNNAMVFDAETMRDISESEDGE